MPFIEWTQKHSVAVPDMDQQHRRLFELANVLHEAMRAGRGTAALSACLDDLYNYTSGHFAAEEDFMKRVHYPLLGEHILEHRQLQQKVEQLRRKLAAGEPVLTMDVMDFVRDWLDKHIMETDARYGRFMRAGLPHTGGAQLSR